CPRSTVASSPATAAMVPSTVSPTLSGRNARWAVSLARSSSIVIGSMDTLGGRQGSCHVHSCKPGAREGDRQRDGSLARPSRALSLAAPGGSGRCCSRYRGPALHCLLTSDRQCRLARHP